MNPANDPSAKGIKTLDKDLRRIALMERALLYTSRPMVAPGVALVFMGLAGLGAMALMGGQPGAIVVVADAETIERELQARQAGLQLAAPNA